MSTLYLYSTASQHQSHIQPKIREVYGAFGVQIYEHAKLRLFIEKVLFFFFMNELLRAEVLFEIGLSMKCEKNLNVSYCFC